MRRAHWPHALARPLLDRRGEGFVQRLLG